MSTEDLSPDDKRAVLEEWREVIPEMMKSLHVNGIYIPGISSEEMTLVLHEPGMAELYAALQSRIKVMGLRDE